jgi:hypothetical protein
MSTQQRVLISIGGAILVILMVVGAFSIGVYVGSERSSSPSPDAGAAQPQPNPQQPDLPRAPDLTGRIQSASGGSLVLSTPDGPRTVIMDDDTEVLRVDGSQGARDDLKRGMNVAVIGTFGDDGRVLLAEIVAILPAQQ